MTLLTAEEIAAALPDGWRYDGDRLVLDRELADFAAAVALVNGVAGEAEAADHHPDILIHDWNRVQLTVCTHGEGGVTAKDIALAVAVNAL